MAIDMNKGIIIAKGFLVTITNTLEISTNILKMSKLNSSYIKSIRTTIIIQIKK
jgi:hypothetical protein